MKGFNLLIYIPWKFPVACISLLWGREFPFVHAEKSVLSFSSDVTSFVLCCFSHGWAASDLSCCPYRVASGLFPCSVTFPLFCVHRQAIHERMLLEAVQKQLLYQETLVPFVIFLWLVEVNFILAIQRYFWLTVLAKNGFSSRLMDSKNVMGFPSSAAIWNFTWCTFKYNASTSWC